MTRKDYDAIAATLREACESKSSLRERLALNEVALSLGDLFARRSPRFNRAKWIKAVFGEDATPFYADWIASNVD